MNFSSSLVLSTLKPTAELVEARTTLIATFFVNRFHHSMALQLMLSLQGQSQMAGCALLERENLRIQFLQ